MPNSHAKHAEFVRAGFNDIWPVHLSAFTRLLRHLRDSFDGDLDLMLVLATIADRTPRERWAENMDDPQRITRDGQGSRSQSPINLQSIADFTGIPRETVRRKVSVLRDRNWISRDAQRHLTVNREAGVDLADATAATVEYLAAIRSALDAAGTAEPERAAAKKA